MPLLFVTHHQSMTGVYAYLPFRRASAPYRPVPNYTAWWRRHV